MSDDSDYSQGMLEIHWDSDVDTAEFLETDDETDDESVSNTEEGNVASFNYTNSSTTYYSQSAQPPLSYFCAWYFLCSLLSTYCYPFLSLPYF